MQEISAWLVALVSGLLSLGLFAAYRRLALARMGQRHRDQGPSHHKAKGAVPTGAGIVIVILLLGGAVWGYLARPASGTVGMLGIYVCIAAAAMGLVGWLDDYRKVRFGSEGLKARYKFPLMVVCGLLLLYQIRSAFLILSANADPSVALQPWPAQASDLLFYAAGLFVWLGALNGANFTDGLDGLLACTTLVVLLGVFYALLDGAEALSLPAAIGLGTLAAYLAFNWKPARLYVGDSGSLAIGALVAGLFLAKGWWLFLGLAAIVWVLEVISVLVQVTSFRLTGKRVLLMSPLHHHFELAGWDELTIVYVFTALQAFGCLAAFAWLRSGTASGLTLTLLLLLVVAALLARYNKRVR